MRFNTRKQEPQIEPIGGIESAIVSLSVVLLVLCVIYLWCGPLFSWVSVP